MKKTIWIIIGKIILSFIILFLLYTIHFVLVKAVFEKAFSGTTLEMIKLLSSFMWSVLGGFITAKIAKESRRNSVIAVAVLTLVYMLLNISYAAENPVSYWAHTFEMVVGVLIGGFYVIRSSVGKENI